MIRVHVCVGVAANVFVAQGYFIRRMPTARKRAPTLGMLGAAKICAAPVLCRRGARGIAARGQVRPLAAASTGVKPGAVGPLDSAYRERVILITLGVFISATTNRVLSKVFPTPGTVGM